MKEMILTDKERELIEAIRNYRNSSHNPSKMLKNIAKEAFDKAMRFN